MRYTGTRLKYTGKTPAVLIFAAILTLNITTGAFLFPRTVSAMAPYVETEEDKKEKEHQQKAAEAAAAEKKAEGEETTEAVIQKVVKKKDVYEYEETKDHGIVIRKKTISVEE